MRIQGPALFRLSVPLKKNTSMSIKQRCILQVTCEDGSHNLEGTNPENTLLKVSIESFPSPLSYSIQQSRDTFLSAALKQEMRRRAAELTGLLCFCAVRALFLSRL